MKELILNDIKRRLNMLAIILGIDIFFEITYILIFPTIQNQQKVFSEMIQQYPQALLEAFNVNLDSLSTFEGYIATEKFSFMWLILLLIFILPAATSICKEIDKGTIEIVLSQPISRFKYALGKYIAGLVQTKLFVIISILLIVPLAFIFQISVKTENFVLLTLGALPFALLIYSITYALGTFFNETGKVYMLSIGFVLIQYFIKIVASLVDDLNNLKYLSIFHYFDVNNILVGGKLDLLPNLVFIILAVIFLCTGLFIFKTKDIP